MENRRLYQLTVCTTRERDKIRYMVPPSTTFPAVKKSERERGDGGRDELQSNRQRPRPTDGKLSASRTRHHRERRARHHQPPASSSAARLPALQSALPPPQAPTHSNPVPLLPLSPAPPPHFPAASVQSPHELKTQKTGQQRQRQRQRAGQDSRAWTPSRHDLHYARRSPILPSPSLLLPLRRPPTQVCLLLQVCRARRPL